MTINILFISHDSHLNGAERSLLGLVSQLDRSCFEPLVLLPWRGPMEEILQQANVPYMVRYLARWIPSRRSTPWHYPVTWLRGLRARLWSLLSLIEQEQIDLIYTNTSTILEGALVARRARIPHVWHIREYLRGNADLRVYLPYALVDRLTIALADCIITPSNALAKGRFRGSTKVRVVPNGVDLTAFHLGEGDQVRGDLGIPPEAPVVTFVGGIIEIKDPFTFIRGASLVSKEISQAHFLMVGDTIDPALAEKVRVYIRAQGLENRIHLLGLRNDVADLLTAATVHVATSIQETFGRTIIEAMAAGKPVVTTHCGGPEEIVVDGETGFVVPQQSPERLAAALIKLLKDPLLCDQFGQAGRERVEAHFTTQAYARHIETILNEIVRSKEVADNRACRN